MENLSFWRGLDSNETTALYTSEKIGTMFAGLSGEYNNDDLKDIFTDSFGNEVWQFIKNGDVIETSTGWKFIPFDQEVDQKVKTLVEQFVDASIKYGEAIEQGDSKKQISNLVL